MVLNISFRLEFLTFFMRRQLAVALSSTLMDQSTASTPDSLCPAAMPPPRQAARLETLRSYDILDTPAEGAFDDLTRIATLVCQTPIAVVNLVDEHRQWFKSEFGLGVRETPLDTSFCAHALLLDDFMEVPDALLDQRFNRNPLVTDGPRLRYYAGALIKTADGHALGTVCVLDTRPRQLNDEQKRVLRALARQAMTQLELRRALIQAAQAHRYRGQLMAIAGHDLKQPLTTVMMMLEQLPGASPAEKKKIELAKEAANRLGLELDDLARASRVEDGGEQIDLELVNLAEFIAEIAASWSYAAKRRKLRLIPEVLDVQVRTHAGMLRTILDNLVGNAIKYTPAGSVTIACRRRDDGLWLDVADTGNGIPDARQDEIFKAFSQLDPGADGLGLGLSIVKSTADMLGYRLNLACGQDCGATFSVVLPPAAVSGHDASV